MPLFQSLRQEVGIRPDRLFGEKFREHLVDIGEGAHHTAILVCRFGSYLQMGGRNIRDRILKTLQTCGSSVAIHDLIITQT
jgi:hypothetical protein